LTRVLGALRGRHLASPLGEPASIVGLIDPTDEPGTRRDRASLSPVSLHLSAMRPLPAGTGGKFS